MLADDTEAAKTMISIVHCWVEVSPVLEYCFRCSVVCTYHSVLSSPLQDLLIDARGALVVSET